MNSAAPGDRVSGPAVARGRDLAMVLESLTALAGLTAMEIVLGIDNVVFLAIVVAPCPPLSSRPRAASASCSP